jgi:uncharacterized protein (DUF1697 family)
MAIYIALLRGINVSGKNSIKMDALVSSFKGFGFENVKSYIQSGNLIFHSKVKNSEEIRLMIENMIEIKFSLDVSVIIRTKADIEQVIKNNPFLKDKIVEIDRLYVTFLSETPDNNIINKLNLSKNEGEEFQIIDKEVYLYCPNGYGRTKLNNNIFESKLKVKATTRNWNTVNKLMEIAEDL